MDLNFVLNDNPTSPRTADTAFNIETTTYKFGPVQHAENPTGFICHNPTSEIPVSSVYNPYHHQSGHYSTFSARSSYSGPSLQSSTAATSPLEMSMSAKSLANLNAENQGYSAINLEDGDLSTGSFGRHLPPLTSVHSQSSTLSVSGEGPLSPHSAPHHYHHQNGLDAGYFPPSSSHGYTYGHHQQPYQLHVFAASQPTHNHGYDNALLTFAEVAMGTATPGGRRSLEAEAAAEALTGRRGSDGTLRRNENVAHIIRMEQERAVRNINLNGNLSSQLDKASRGVSSHADIEYVPDSFPLLSAGLRFGLFANIYIVRN